MAGDRSGKRLRPKTGILIGLDRFDDAIKAQAFDEKSALRRPTLGSGIRPPNLTVPGAAGRAVETDGQTGYPQSVRAIRLTSTYLTYR